MREETIVKKLKEILKERNPKKLYKKLQKLTNDIETKLQKEKERKEKYGNAIRHLVGWYLTLWNNRPPESFGRTKYQATIGKVFRELIIIYENNNLTIDDIKKDYKNFMEGNNIQKFLLGDKSITRFKYILPQLKQAQKNTKDIKKDRWISDEFRHDDSIYGKSVIDADDLIPEEINNEDVPF